MVKKNNNPVDPALRDAWVEACSSLVLLMDKYNYVNDDASIWDAFKYLYLGRVKDTGRGRRAKGVENVFTD